VKHFVALLSLLLATLIGPQATARETRPAPEFPASLQWLNVSRPITLKDLRGKVVILDFWTYGCVNCMHIIPDLKKLEKKWGNKIAIIGVHSPKFDNEKNLETLRKIVVRYDRRHPIVSDVDFDIFRAYGATAWPTIAVVDPAGMLIGGITGEGHYELLDAITEDLLHKFKGRINSKPLPIALEKEKFKDHLLAAPEKIAVSDRYVAISDSLHHRILITDHGGKLIQIVGGKEAGDNVGTPDKARFHTPRGLAFSDKGIYVADTGNHRIKFINLTTWKTKNIAGTGENERNRWGHYIAAETGLSSPWALAYAKPYLYISSAGSHQIWRLNENKGVLETFAGFGDEDLRDGDLRHSAFAQPSGLSLLGDKLYIADAEDSAVRVIDLKKKTVRTLIGEGLFDWGDRDGGFPKAELQHVTGITALNRRYLIIADTYNHKLKRLDLKKKTVRTLLGNGKPGKNGLRELNEPAGLALLDGKILATDTNNDRILMLDANAGKVKEFRIHK